MCVCNTSMRFQVRRCQTRCGCWEHRGSGYSGVDGTRLVVGRELSVYFRFFLRRRRPFFNYLSRLHPVSPDLICSRPTFEFKPIITILSCSSNIVAEGIGGQASDAIARRRWATLLVMIYRHCGLFRPSSSSLYSLV